VSIILVVDDVAANREFLVTLLQYQGHRLLQAVNGRAGLEIARVERPDLVITDVLMPEMDGYELVKQLRLDPATKSIPVIFYTAHYGAREAKSLALQGGVSHVLTKPTEPEEVLKIVGNVLSGRTPTSSPAVSMFRTEFDQEHLRLVTAKLSETVEDVRVANTRLRALINIGLELASERDTRRLVQDVCIAARDLFGASYATLGITSADDGTVDYVVVDGVQGAGWIGNGDVLTGVLGAVVSERRTLRGDNAGGQAGVPRLPDEHPEVRAFLAAPLSSPSRVYGWIMLVNNEGRRFTDDDEQLLLALAGQVGRIYENGYFYGEARAERDRAQRYLDTAEVILLALDEQGRISQVNRYACSILGWSAADLQGRDWVETCVPERFRRARRERFLSLPAGEDLSVTESPVLTRSGEERMIEWRTTVLRDAAGRASGVFSSGTDITERIAAQARLRLQSAALNAAANAIVITDRSGMIEWVNPAFTTLTGYGAEEALGRNPHDLVTSGMHDREFYRELWETIQSGRVWHGEITNRRKDGTLYTEEQTITPVQNAQDEVLHFIAVKQDVSDRNRHDAQLRERTRISALGADVGLALAAGESLAGALQACTEALVRHLDAAFARIWTLDERDDMLVLRASAGLYTHLDGSHGRVPVGQFKIGRIARDRKPHLTNSVVGDPEVNDQAWARREGMIAFAGHPLVVDGRVVGVMALFARHELSDSVIAALSSVADHVALGIERHRSAETLKITEERMRFALDSADIGIWDMDYTTGVLNWSDTAHAHYGVTPGNFDGTFAAFLDRVHPDDRDALLQTIDAAMKNASEFTTLHRAVWPDGTIHWLQGAGRIHHVNGKPVRAVGISMDVTKHRVLEEQFQQAQKMEAVGRLAGGVAHDFNNLLTAIIGYCELLLTDLGENDPRRGDVIEIQKAGNRAAGLTRQLLAFSRKQIIEPKLLDLHDVVSDMRGMLSRLIGEDVKIVVVDAVRLAKVKADRGEVEQVVMNLAVNARDAMPRGGTLTIETANVELEEEYAQTHLDVQPGGYVALTVTDTGTGIPPEIRERLFEPFFTTKPVGRGTGLGLATVYGIVKRSGGSIGVYSEVGKGTSFRAYFPRATAEEKAATPVSTTRVRTGTQTVLVVEDADGLRDLTKRLLQRLGYTVVTASNSEEAIRVFESTPSIDVLLTDVVMPGASGPELARELMSRSPELRVIYMSGYTEDSIVQHGVLNPGIAFLHKPFTPNSLSQKLSDVLDH
jgi:two-component system cell cycle sensor histidine kinase/response regulator CckA